MGFFIIHPHQNEDPPIHRDYALFLHEWRIPLTAETPDPFEMLDFNLFTFNCVLYPTIEPLIAQTGERVRIRMANIMVISHPIHLHGHEFTVTRKGAGRIPPSAQYTEVTANVAAEETRGIEFLADNPVDWALHCHKTHHIMNQMAHNLPNLLSIEKGSIEEKIKKYFPEFKGLMGTNGMGEMFQHSRTHLRLPNLSPLGSPGPFGIIELGGMFTLLKVRDHLPQKGEIGWYKHPNGTVAEAISSTVNRAAPIHDNH